MLLVAACGTSAPPSPEPAPPEPATMTDAPRPARARVVRAEDALELVLDIPTTSGLDAVTYPSAGTSQLVITPAGGAPITARPERFEARLDGGRVRVSLPSDLPGPLALSGTLEARNPDGAVVGRWPLPAEVSVP